MIWKESKRTHASTVEGRSRSYLAIGAISMYESKSIGLGIFLNFAMVPSSNLALRSTAKHLSNTMFL